MMVNLENALFLMPFWADDENFNEHYLTEAVESIYNQTDKNWFLLIIDDCSPSKKAITFLAELEQKNNKKVKILFSDKNEGPGFCRNTGIRWAKEQGFPFILFNDSDDCSHKDRLYVVRDIFRQMNGVDVIYSTFSVIDEMSKKVDNDKLTPSIIEILEALKTNPARGKNAWIDIGIRTGYVNLTSSTAVRTNLADKYPFPGFRVSEDAYAWLCYAAGGNEFFYTNKIPSLYRIPQKVEGSASRSREGGKENFWKLGAANDIEGFLMAMEIATARDPELKIDKDKLFVQFLIRLSETLIKENQLELAKEQINKAKSILPDFVEKLIYKEIFNILWRTK